jgi:hypothetical protein
MLPFLVTIYIQKMISNKKSKMIVKMIMKMNLRENDSTLF